MSIEERISEIGEKVKQKKGELILSLRELCFPGEVTGDFIPPQPENSFYYEAGILNGEIQEKADYFNLRFPALFLKENPSYFMTTQYSIPIDRKIQGFLTFLNSFNFDVEKDLEQIKDGEVSFGILELENNNSFFKHDSPLQKFSLLIGDKEVENFLKEREIRNTEEFFDTFYNTEKIDGKISRHHFDERKKFGNDLSVIANYIAQDFEKVKKLEGGVMNAKYIIEADQDGTNRYWDNSNVNHYHSLKSQILIEVEAITKKLETGKKLYTKTNFPLIDGRIIGFPGAVIFSEYSRWLKDEFIPEIKQTFEKIDKHLREEEKNGNY